MMLQVSLVLGGVEVLNPCITARHSMPKEVRIEEQLKNPGNGS
jgi:hypothetical protein